MDYLDALSAFAAGLRFDELPAAVRRHTGWVLADTLAAIVAGAAEPELQAMAARVAHGSGAALPGLGREAGADAAALVNGTAGTFLEMDEGNRFARGHPAVHVLPAALALCEERGAGRAELLSGLVAGYEVGSRLGAASQLRAAMHPHGTWGTPGAAAGCARVLGADAAAMRESINVGASMSTATSKKTMLQGGLVRNVYAGLAARNGLLAAQLVGCGFGGERDGPGALFGEIVSERFDRAAVLQGLGSDWHLMHNYFKLHSCCRYNHGALDALDLLAARGALPQAADIARIEVQSYSLAAELDDPAPRNTLAAKFSLPFAVATRIVHGSSAMASFTWPAVRNPEVLALARKVTVREDPAMTRRLPQERPARVSIVEHGGAEQVAAVGVNRGDDAAPYTADDLRGKFLDLCGRAWTQRESEELLEATLALCETPPSDAAAQRAFGDWRAMLRRPARAQ